MICLFSHIGLNCRNIQETAAFYEKYFGFRLVRRIGNGSSKDSVLYIRMPGSPVLFELFFSDGEPPDGPETGNGPPYPGFRHLAFQVDNIDSFLSDMGPAALVTQAPENFDDLIPGWRSVWIRDPDGRIIEISQGYRDQDYRISATG